MNKVEYNTLATSSGLAAAPGRRVVTRGIPASHDVRWMSVVDATLHHSDVTSHQDNNNIDNGTVNSRSTPNLDLTSTLDTPITKPAPLSHHPEP